MWDDYECFGDRNDAAGMDRLPSYSEATTWPGGLGLFFKYSINFDSAPLKGGSPVCVSGTSSV